MGAPADTLVVDSYRDGECRVLSFKGELDIATAATAEQALTADVDVLDLSELEFMDSSGVKVLLRACHARAQERLRVRGVRHGVRRILEMTGVGDLLDFEDNGSDQVG
jgi:anti-anti-sigma factor